MDTRVVVVVVVAVEDDCVDAVNVGEMVDSLGEVVDAVGEMVDAVGEIVDFVGEMADAASVVGAGGAFDAGDASAIANVAVGVVGEVPCGG